MQTSQANPAILVVGPAWVGDMVMAQSLFISLKKNFPDYDIDVLAPAWTRPVLQRMPQIRNALEMPLGHGEFGWGIRRSLGKKLIGQYQRAVVMPRSWKSALIPWFARIPFRTGYLGEFRYGLLNDARKLDKGQHFKTVERFVALAQPAGFKGALAIDYPRLEIDADARQKTLDVLEIALPEKPVLVICPGAEFGPSKQWPSDYYTEVAARMLEVDWDVWVIGSRNDQTIGRSIALMTKSACRDLTGKTTLDQAVDLISLASVVISNDSGLMHVAAALGRPQVALFGSSDPLHTPPLNRFAHVLALDMECRPCMQRECPPGHLDCLRKIMPDQVIDEILSVAAEYAAGQFAASASEGGNGS